MLGNFITLGGSHIREDSIRGVTPSYTMPAGCGKLTGQNCCLIYLDPGTFPTTQNFGGGDPRIGAGTTYSAVPGIIGGIQNPMVLAGQEAAHFRTAWNAINRLGGGNWTQTAAAPPGGTPTRRVQTAAQKRRAARARAKRLAAQAGQPAAPGVKMTAKQRAAAAKTQAATG